MEEGIDDCENTPDEDLRMATVCALFHSALFHSGLKLAQLAQSCLFSSQPPNEHRFLFPSRGNVSAPGKVSP